MLRKQTRMYGPNKFKLGLFGMNCSNGMTMTKAPERWDHSWRNNVTAARLADDAGLEFVLPIGRWNGYKGETDTAGASWETLTWASALLAATQGICVFGTLHVAFINPLFAAKQIVTADHVGEGRFGLNIVSGWNRSEFDMFGIELLDHDIRYDYTEEWVTIAKKIWSETKPFDFDGKWFKLRAVEGAPKPWGNSFPMLVSAGSSAEGRAFAARHVDCLFTSISTLDTLPQNVAAVRAIAEGSGRSVQIFCSGHALARPTRKEAEDYYHYIVHEQGDWAAAEHLAKIRQSGPGRKDWANIKERIISGMGTYPVVGSYDDVANSFKAMTDAGLHGMAIGLINYIDEFPHIRDEVLPRMVRLGIRQARNRAAA
jgi:FMNH2-dependent dimethyl sulfone monooxygenase